MKITKIISGIAAAAAAAFCMTFTAFAEPMDYEPDMSTAIETEGNWGQSITFTNGDIDPRGIGPDTTIEVTYELTGDKTFEDQHPVELILQNYSVEPQIWAQAIPTEYDDTHAVFDYAAMTLAYGTEDLSTVNNICIGDRGVKMKAISIKVTNYEPQYFEPNMTRAIETTGNWGQSITFSNADLNPQGIGPNTTIEVEYELSGDKTFEDQHPVELILQNYNAEPQIWAQIMPIEYDDTHAVFNYEAMVNAYGSDDFSTVNNICVSDRGVKMKATSVKVMHYNPPAVVTVPEENGETAESKPAESGETAAAAEDASAETTAAAEASTAPVQNNNTVIFIIIIGAVVLVSATIVIIVVSKANKKRFY